MECSDSAGTVLEMMDEEEIDRLCAENLMYLSSSPPQQTMAEKECQVCQRKKTPMWRRNDQFHTLCNACGIRLRVKKIIY